MVLPVAQSWQTFDADGRLVDEMVVGQLRELGAEVVRAARQFQAEGTCDYADSVQFSPDGREPASAGSREREGRGRGAQRCHPARMARWAARRASSTRDVTPSFQKMWRK